MLHKIEIDFLISGIKIEDEYNGRVFSVAKCEVVYPGDQKLTNCVRIQYAISIDDDSNLPEQDYINRVLDDEVNSFLYLLSLMLARPSHLVHYTALLDGIKVEMNLPPATLPRGLYNLLDTWSYYPILATSPYFSLVKLDGWALLEDVINEFRKQSVQLRHQLTLPLRWYKKASDETTSLDRLIAYWIAFNSLYENPIKTEQDAIKGYLAKNANVVAQQYVRANKDLLLDLSNFNIELGRGANKTPIAQKLSTLLKTSSSDYISIVKIAALTIYAIRNRLFHGAYDPDADEAQEHIEIAERLLSKLLREILAQQILGYLLPATKFVVEEEMYF